MTSKARLQNTKKRMTYDALQPGDTTGDATYVYWANAGSIQRLRKNRGKDAPGRKERGASDPDLVVLN